MKVLSTCLVISSLAALAVGCSKKTEQAPEPPPEVVQVTAPAEAPPPMPTDDRPPVANAGDPPPMPTDHRLRLGIDGDPGYTQEELTPEELAEARAAGAAVPQPSYAQQPSEPSSTGQPREPSDDVDEESSDTVYVGGTRAPVYRHHVREEAGADKPREPRPAAQPHRSPRR
jgi:hypothetical protein